MEPLRPDTVGPALISPELATVPTPSSAVAAPPPERQLASLLTRRAPPAPESRAALPNAAPMVAPTPLASTTVPALQEPPLRTFAAPIPAPPASMAPIAPLAPLAPLAAISPLPSAASDKTLLPPSLPAPGSTEIVMPEPRAAMRPPAMPDVVQPAPVAWDLPAAAPAADALGKAGGCKW